MMIHAKIIDVMDDMKAVRLSVTMEKDTIQFERVFPPREHELVHIKLEYMLYEFVGSLAPYYNYTFDSRVHSLEEFKEAVKEYFIND